MKPTFKINFPNKHTASVVRVQEIAELPTALDALGLSVPRPTLVLVGGAGKLKSDDSIHLRRLFERLATIAQDLQISIVDGGTHAGVIKLMGDARAQIDGTFPLIGVAAEQTITLPGNTPVWEQAWTLDPHHTQFVLVPGSNWGDESPWISHVASALAGTIPSVTVLINGGEIAWDDITNSVNANRPVITIAGSGRTADTLADTVHGKTEFVRAVKLIRSGKIHSVELTAPSMLIEAIKQILFPR